ncbi:hypothetical protein EW146_g79 [Bondarzewia mesenterica]|uniref:Uncharacterized protein n=1 Tax=Bondarzewia mesenterica TaxID=1095465 RepID=A0A4S4M8L8_9AGAM|nr:hypothetical protein EW146_g79 [Bondarzewia mesenterica]
MDSPPTDRIDTSPSSAQAGAAHHSHIDDNPEVEEVLTEENIKVHVKEIVQVKLAHSSVQECLRDAEESKQDGNEYFRAKRWNEALIAYKRGLGRLPKRKDAAKENAKGKGREVPDDDDERDSASSRETPAAQPDEGDQPETISTTPLEAECAKARSILNANIGACHVKLGEHEDAVNACAEALLDDPRYIKALLRRAQSNEHIGSWSSLSSAQEDYNTLLILLPSSSAQTEEVKRSLHLLKPRVEEAQKREMGEMMDKLKGIGNSILGNFGMSTDNFKFEPNGKGGYSMNFVR